MPSRRKREGFDFEGMAALITAMAKLLNSFALLTRVFFRFALLALILMKPEPLIALGKSLGLVTGSFP